MYDIRVVVDEVKGFCDMPMKPGDYFEVRGGRIIIPDGKYMCLWALQSLMPMLPLKQRKIDEENDWVPNTNKVCCPDPNGMVIYRIDIIESKEDDKAHEALQKEEGPKPRIIVDFEKCTGCRACETVCSFNHTGSFCGENSKIKIKKVEHEGLDMPHICRQCGNAPCVHTCPEMALYRDDNTKAVLIDYDRCTGCKICQSACPFDSISFDKDSGKAVICDLCGGKPACVGRCPSGAISLGNAGEKIKTESNGR